MKPKNTVLQKKKENKNQKKLSDDFEQSNKMKTFSE